MTRDARMNRWFEEAVGRLDAGTAGRIRYLWGAGPDAPAGKPMHCESLRHFVDFMAQWKMPRPMISLGSDGLVNSEWDVGECGVLAMEFQISGHVRFITLDLPEAGCDRRNVPLVSRLPHEMMRMLGPIVDALRRPESNPGKAP